MANLCHEYCAYFGEATEVWKRFVIGEITVIITVAFDEYRDSVCQTLQDAVNSGANASTRGGKDINNQEEMFGVVLENAQQQAEQRIFSALNLTLNHRPPSVSLSPVVSILTNQTAQVNPPGESAIFQGSANFGQNDGDDDSLDVSIKSEDTDDKEVKVKQESNEEEEEDITGRSEEQTENDNNHNFNDNRENDHVDAEDEADGNLEDDEQVDNMEIEENGGPESDNGGSMIDEGNDGEEFDHLEEQVNMSGVEDNDEDSTDDTKDDENAEDEQAAGPSTSTGRTSTRPVVKRQIVPDRQSNGQIKMKKTEPLRVITLKLKCTVPGCKKVVKNKNALNAHFLSTHKLKKYRCLVRRCYGKVSTSFATKGQINDHRDQVHGRTTRWTCHCSKKFKSYKELYTHYWSYHQLGLFACSKDGCPFKRTSTRNKIMNHQYHHFEAKYACPVDDCDRSFKKKGNLEIHNLIHTGERPFPCLECDKSFTVKCNLTTHLRIHRNDKCYRCTWPQCTHSTSDHGNVIQHIRTVHFKLPATKRQQTEENITDDRDARQFLAKN